MPQWSHKTVCQACLMAKGDPWKLETWPRNRLSERRPTDPDMLYSSFDSYSTRWRAHHTDTMLANLAIRYTVSYYLHLFLFLLIRLLQCSLSDSWTIETKSANVCNNETLCIKKTADSRSRSLCPLCVILLPPRSSSFSSTPMFSSACITLRSTDPLAST